jgi:formate-dependent nitrite reductase membrane component NrfD
MTHELDGQVQTEWKWPIAADLFLAGTGAGAYATGVMASYGGPEWAPVAKTGVALAVPLVLLATFFLLLDLGVKMRALRVFLNPGTSWITRGSFIISGFMTLAFVHLVLMVWPGQMAVDAPLVRLIGAVNLVFAILVMIYTGALLGASRPIAFWNTAMLPVLFLVSAATMGMMAVVLLTPASTVPISVFGLLSKALLALLVLNIILVAFYIQASHRTDESRASAHLLLKGGLASAFWYGLVVVGLLIPLALLVIDVTVVKAETLWLIRTAAVCGLVGGFILRRLVLAAGVKNILRAAGIDFTFPSPIAR